jgi:putative phage-type endonuclease
MELEKVFIDKALKANGFNVTQTLKFFGDKVTKKVLQERLKNIICYQKQLKHLLHLPQVEQKTDAWYKMRMNMITASDFAQALGEGKFGTTKQLIQKKCEPADESSASWSNTIMRWGNMFEDVAVTIYKELNGVDVYQFGLIQHPKRTYFGASPDGISDLGIMLEIKCPFKRKITGEIPMQYYYQIQGQLDVCGLSECDYFECEFEVVDNMNEFLVLTDVQFKGIIIEKPNNKFVYSSLNVDEYHSKLFLEQKTSPSDKVVFWKLKKYNMKRVEKDDIFVKSKLDELESVWNKIVYYRENPDKYEMEVKNSIDIETEKYKYGNNGQKQVIVSGYSMRDL